MNNDREYYIFGLPIETKYGKVRFLTFFEYIQLSPELSLMSQNVLHFYYHYKSYYDKQFLSDEEKSQVNEVLQELKKEKLFNIVTKREDLLIAYKKVFDLVIEVDSTDFIFEDEEIFMEFRSLILDMNIVSESLVSPNEEIQKGIERSRRFKQNQNKDKQTFSDIVSSIAVGAGILPRDTAHMTVLQVYSIYYRISKFQNYNTTTLFATVSEKVEIENWSTHIDMWEKETDGMEKSEFDQKYGNIF